MATDGSNNRHNNKPLPKRALVAQQRELEELRRFGLAPLERDVRTGEEISPLIPRMLSDAPFYLQTSGPTLAHQRQDRALSDTEALTGKVQTQVVGEATKFRAGACTNCGAMGHTAKNCLRPKRKVQAAYSNKPIAKDLKVVDGSAGVKKTFQQKKDVFRNVTSEDYDDVWDSHTDGPDALEVKRMKKEESTKGAQKAGQGMFAEQSGDHVTTLTDIGAVPKYLENLSTDAVFFDPRSRSMRANPNAAGATSSAYQGDNANYDTEGYREAIQLQHFAQTNTETGSSFLPTANEQAFRKAKADEEAEAVAKAAALDALYGKEETATSDPTPAASSVQTGMPPPAPADSKPEEEKKVPADVESAGTASTEALVQFQRAAALGHTSVFGSFFDRAAKKWGYKCCRGTDQSAFCPNLDAEEDKVTEST